MLDYIRDNLPHAPTCPAKFLTSHHCTCPRAEALRWLEDREAFVDAFRAWKTAEDTVDRLATGATLTAAFARLEGE